ncbi:MAG: OadG family protein [Christensenellaceae bacterium]|nr:OadG family protein [Christensenellaceae bacterium]
MSLFSKGLIISGLGLCGVFLVLALFYVTIKLMQKIDSNKGAKENN